MTNNILVTGVRGFVGSNFVLQANAEKFNVIGLSWTKNKWNAEV
jgi:nucleoside-diphosphate-sugar epimerase